ncbi:MAG: hypothetical protein ABSE62_16305 [Chthoniobacteraceae bacterium]|jgi:hypothetical protein
MSKNTSTMLVDVGTLLALMAISLGVWYYPWFAVIALALLLFTGCVLAK